MDEGKEKETDVAFDGNTGCDESDKANESEDEIARYNEGKDSEDNNSQPSLEEFLTRMMRDLRESELSPSRSGHAETTEGNSEQIGSQSLGACDSGDVVQVEEVRLGHVSSDQEGGEGHVSNDQDWRRIDVNRNVLSEAEDRFAKMISTKCQKDQELDQTKLSKQ